MHDLAFLLVILSLAGANLYNKSLINRLQQQMNALTHRLDLHHSPACPVCGLPCRRCVRPEEEREKTL